MLAGARCLDELAACDSSLDCYHSNGTQACCDCTASARRLSAIYAGGAWNFLPLRKPPPEILTRDEIAPTMTVTDVRMSDPLPT